MKPEKVESLLRAALLCRDVYQQTMNTSRLSIHNIVDVRPKQSDCGAFACAYVSPQTIYLTVRGSKTWADWRSNMKAIFQTDYYGCMIHRGFATAARGLEESVFDLLESNPNHNITFLGHSRGGTVAMALAIACYKQRLGRPSKVVTFGAPKLGRAEQIKDAYPGAVIDVINGSDAVVRRPNLPHYGRHATCRVYLPNRRKGIITNPSKWLMFRDRTFTFGQRGGDHLIDDYVRELSFYAAINP